MPFHRFEELQSHRFNPHLSSTEGPVIEGELMYFRRVKKRAGTGARLHYHPNELLAFVLEGACNSVVGSQRSLVEAGTLIHMPPYAQHELFATEERDLHYLYIKDRTWTLIGAAADEALPERALSAVEVQKALAEGRYPGRDKAPEQSRAITEGLGNCFYPMTAAFTGEPPSGKYERRVEGTYIAFEYVESPPRCEAAAALAPHELFVYVISGSMAAEAAGERRTLAAGDVMHVRRGSGCGWQAGEAGVRYAAVRSLPALEQAIEANGAADNWRG